MPDIKFEPIVIGLLNDLLDFLKRNPHASGVVYGRTTDGLLVTIKITNESIAHTGQ